MQPEPMHEAPRLRPQRWRVDGQGTRLSELFPQSHNVGCRGQSGHVVRECEIGGFAPFPVICWVRPRNRPRQDEREVGRQNGIGDEQAVGENAFLAANAERSFPSGGTARPDGRQPVVLKAVSNSAGWTVARPERVRSSVAMMARSNREDIGPVSLCSRQFRKPPPTW